MRDVRGFLPSLAVVLAVAAVTTVLFQRLKMRLIPKPELRVADRIPAQVRRGGQEVESGGMEGRPGCRGEE